MAVRLNKAVKQSVSLLSGFKQWGYKTDITSATTIISLPISYPTNALSLAVAITGWDALCAADSLTKEGFRYRGTNELLPNIRWISIGYSTLQLLRHLGS